MNSTLKAADEVKKLARMFQALGDVVEVLERVGSLDQAEQEARARIDRLNTEAESISAKIKAANDKAAAVRATVEGIDATANENAEALVEQAKTEAKRISAAASSAANKTVAGAKEYADAAMASALAAQGREKEATAALVEIDNRIERAKAQIAKLLG